MKLQSIQEIADFLEVPADTLTPSFFRKLKQYRNFVPKYAKYINLDCCTHYNGENVYVIGYIGLPIFKLAICHECKTVFFLGKDWLYPLFKQAVLANLKPHFGAEGMCLFINKNESVCALAVGNDILPYANPLYKENSTQEQPTTNTGDLFDD